MIDRREFLQTTLAGAAAFAVVDRADGAQAGDADRAAVVGQIAPRHAATLKMLQDWIALPSIAAENLNYPQGPSTWRGWRARRGSSASRSSRPRASPASSPRSTPARDDARRLLHVRREAVRSGRVELAAARGAASSIGPASARSWSAAARRTPRDRRWRCSPRCMRSRPRARSSR